MRMRSWEVILVAASAALWASPAAGQTLFEPPDAAVDVSTYTTIEECWAAFGRVRGSIARQEGRISGVWSDTMPYDPKEDFEPLPAAVGETARRCMGRFATVDSVPLEYFSVLVPLYVHAGWEAKAQALVERRIAAIEPDDEDDYEDELAAVLDTVTRIYQGRTGGPLRVRPRRPALAWETVLKHLPRISDRVARLLLYLEMLSMLRTEDGDVDPARVQEIAARMVALPDSMTDEERRRLEKQFGFFDPDELEEQVSGFFKVLSHGEDAFLDSLRRSTASYVRARRQAWAEVTARPPETFGLGMPIGERAPALEADIWLGCDEPCGPRPRAGAVSLVYFLDHGACVGVVAEVDDFRDICADNLIALRRLEERFPMLETTIIAQTHGYFRYLKESITPEREAELIRRWVGSLGVRAAVAVNFTDHWRLPDPDGRRIDRELPNHTNYSFGKTWRVGGKMFLIDQAGIIVHSGQLHRVRAVDYAELIEVMLERGAAAS